MDWIYLGLLAICCFFLFTATLGLFTMPDVFTRMHATTKCDTVAAGCALLAVSLKSGSFVVAAKLLLVFLFILMINPATAHMIAWTATEMGTEEACPEREAS